ncbi:MAG TPA: hypothetical protein VGF23_05840 [Gaiellaceae bacterium]|jgi:hypothetical protein
MVVSRTLLAARRLPAAALCALAAHALVYGSLWPTDGAHGYFGWYEPVVAALSIAALLALVGLLAVAAAARRLGRPLVRATPGPPSPLGPVVRSRMLAALVFLFGQETLERSLQAGGPAPASFTPSGWLLLLVGVGAAAFVLTLALRLCRAAAERAIGRATPARRPVRGLAPVGWSLVPSTPRRPRPLAARRALRAPPLLAG